MMVWICNPFDILPGEKGRPMRYALLSETLVQAGHQVVFWSSDFHHLLRSKRHVPSAYCHHGIHIRLIPTRPYYRNVGMSRLWSHHRFARDWQRLALLHAARAQQRPDVILCSAPPVSLFGAGECLARQCNARLLLDVQDLWPETFYRVLPRCFRPLGKLLFMPLHQKMRRAYRRADGVSAISATYRAIIQRDDLRVFPLGVKLPERLEDKPAADDLRLCYVGNLGSGYCLEAMLAGVEQLIQRQKAVRLTIAGDGVKRRLVEGYAARYQQIRYQGFVDGDGLDMMLRDSDVGIVPMRAESGVAIPNKIVDYAGYGLAVLSGLKGDAEKTLSDYQAGVSYQVEDHLSFADTVDGLLDNAAWVVQMGRNARKLAEELFDANQIFPAFVQWIEKIKWEKIK